MVKITKSHARALYNDGQEVMIIPCNMRTDSFMASWTSKPKDDPDADFDKLCNAISYYNCSPETGMRLSYYMKA